MNRIVDTATEHELRAFLKHRKKELRLTDEECLCLRIRRRRLSLERKRQGAAAAVSRTHPHHAESQLRTPIKLVCVGEEGSGHVALLQSLLCPGDEVLPITTVELPLGDGQSCLAQLWAPETSESGKPLRSALFECAEAFLLAFDVHDAGTLQTLVARLYPEVAAHLETQRADAPVVLVGVVRGSGHGGAERLTAAQASALAARLGVSRYVEVHEGSSREAAAALQLAASLALEERARLGPADAAALALRFERTDALLREFLTAPMPAVGVDTEARLLTLRERPAAGVRVHYAYGTEASVDAPFLDARRPAAPLPPVLPAHVSLLAVGRALYPSPPATLPLPRYCGPGRKQKVSLILYLAAGAASPASAPSPTRASLRLPSSFARCFCCTAR